MSPAVPTHGEGVADLASSAVREAIAGLAARGSPDLPSVLAAVFQVNEQDRAWVDAKCTPQPLATLIDRVALTGAHRATGPRPGGGLSIREVGHHAGEAGERRRLGRALN